jgi:hypothetical protein
MRTCIYFCTCLFISVTQLSTVNINDLQLNEFTKQIYVGLHFKSVARTAQSVQ